jgi:hypothetical protein
MLRPEIVERGSSVGSYWGWKMTVCQSFSSDIRQHRAIVCFSRRLECALQIKSGTFLKYPYTKTNATVLYTRQKAPRGLFVVWETHLSLVPFAAHFPPLYSSGYSIGIEWHVTLCAITVLFRSCELRRTQRVQFRVSTITPSRPKFSLWRDHRQFSFRTRTRYRNAFHLNCSTTSFR